MQVITRDYSSSQSRDTCSACSGVWHERFHTRVFIQVLVGVALLVVVCTAGAEDSDELRPYFSIRAGGAWFASPGIGGGVSLKNPSQWPFPNFGFGVNLNKHWGVELAVDYVETNLKNVPGGMEYAMWDILFQGRYRYPVLDDRLVPYVVGGVGLGIGEGNDFQINPASPLRFSATQDTTFIGSLGVGLEYFVAPNITVDVQAKHVFGFSTDAMLNGMPASIDADHTLVSAGFRVFFDDASDPSSPVYPAADNDYYKWYLSLRTGGAFWGDTSTSSPAVMLTTPSLIDWGATVGVNIGEHWGFEVAGEQYETTISTTQLGLGEVAEYAYWNVLGLGRYRFPLKESRLVPYAVGGLGWAWTNVNDPRIPATVLAIPTRTDSGFVGTFGGGVDYFVARNISLNGELRYVWPFDTTARIGNALTTFDNQALQLQVGLRLYF